MSAADRTPCAPALACSFLACTSLACSLAACDISDPIPFRPDASGPPACPSIVPPGGEPQRVWIDQLCRPRRCGGRLSQDACLLRLELSDCAETIVEGTVGPSGAVTLETGLALGTCRANPAAQPQVQPVLLELECDLLDQPCRVDVLSTEGSTLAADVTRARLLDVPPRVSSAFERRAFGAFDPYTGYAGGFALLSDRAVAATHGGSYRAGRICTSTATSLIVHVDLERVVAIATSTAPRCLQAIAADPIGDGFLAAFGGAEHTLVRFDRTGRRRASSPVPAAATLAPGAHVTALIPEAASGGVLIALADFDTPPSGSLVARHDLVTLAPVASTAPARARFRGGALTPEGTVAITDDFNGRVLLLDRTTLESVDGFILQAPTGASNAAGYVIQSPSGEEILVAGSGDESATIWILSPRESSPADRIAAGAPYYQRAARSWAIAPWAAVPGSVLVGLVGTESPHEALVARFDPATSRYSPGERAIGIGLVSQMQADAAGRVWALLPWEAQLARVRPAER